MGRAVMIDGQLVADADARVSVFDRGFLYGDSVFETIRTYRGVPYALDEHLARLQWSAERVFITLPVGLEVLGREVVSTVRAADNPESYVRVMVTRGQGELGLPPQLAERPLRVIIAARLEPPPAEAYSEGIGVITFRTQRMAEATDAAGAKVGNYLVAVLAMRQAREAGAVEALIVDGHDHVLEGASSNLFMVLGGRLVTPPESAGILAGITRKGVMEVAAALGLAVELRPIALDELSRADELFISSSIRELLPVVRVDQMRVGGGTPGPITRRLLEGFRKKVINTGT